jgi:hypothetical protein
METYRRIKDLVVYQKLRRLHIEIYELTRQSSRVDFLNPEPCCLSSHYQKLETKEY